MSTCSAGGEKFSLTSKIGSYESRNLSSLQWCRFKISILPSSEFKSFQSVLDWGNRSLQFYIGRKQEARRWSDYWRSRLSRRWRFYQRRMAICIETRTKNDARSFFSVDSTWFCFSPTSFGENLGKYESALRITSRKPWACSTEPVRLLGEKNKNNKCISPYWMWQNSCPIICDSCLIVCIHLFIHWKKGLFTRWTRELNPLDFGKIRFCVSFVSPHLKNFKDLKFVRSKTALNGRRVGQTFTYCCRFVILKYSKTNV